MQNLKKKNKNHIYRKNIIWLGVSGTDGGTSTPAALSRKKKKAQAAVTNSVSQALLPPFILLSQNI